MLYWINYHYRELKRIYNVSQEESRSIYPLIEKNGNDLLYISSLAQMEGKYGVALSLMILGAEEYAKSLILLLHGWGVKVFEIKEIRQSFYMHKKKHEVAILIQLTSIIDSIIKGQVWNKRRKKRKKNRSLSWRDRTIRGFLEMGDFIKPLVDMGLNISWWDRADSYKNRGLYVDYMDKLLTPSDITLQDMNRAKPAVNELRAKLKMFKSLFSKSSKNEIEAFVRNLNESISIYNSNSKEESMT